MRSAVLVLAGFAVTAAGAMVRAGELTPYQASYNFTTHGINAGAITTTLRHSDQGQWSAERVAQPRGFARLLTDATRERSELEIAGGGVRPLRYSGSNGGAEHEVSLNFDWQQKRATGTIAGKPIDTALKPGMQDDLSMLIAFAHELDNGRTLTSVATIGDAGVRDYQLTREGGEQLHTALGDIDTVVYRAQRSGSPRSTRYWCAPSLGFLPLRAEQRRNDELQWTMDIASLKR
jgi:hypothetical protein